MWRGRVHLKTNDEIALMAKAGSIVAEVLDEVESHVVPGVSTFELDCIAQNVLGRYDARSAFKDYPHESGGAPFPGVLCTSVNQAIVHGIPSRSVVLSEGDIITVDFGCEYQGYFGDSARTIAVGSIASELQCLIDATRQALDAAIAVCRPGNRVFEIGASVQAIAERHSFEIVREFVGHGIGRSLHEDPEVPNYVPQGLTARSGLRLRAGMVLAIEPMFNLGTAKTRRLEDGWTIVTADNLPSAHFEHTVAITEDEPIILTSR